MLKYIRKLFFLDYYDEFNAKIYYLILLIVFSDVFTGWFALFFGLYSGYEQSQKLVTLLPGMATRAFLLLVLLSYVLKYRSNILSVVSLFVLCIFTEIVNTILYSRDIASFFVGFIYSYKMLYIFICYLFVFKFRDEINPAMLVDIFSLSFFIYVFAIIFGHVIGMEYHTYGGKGSTGFLIQGSANSISVVFIALFSCVLVKFRRSIFKASLLMLIGLYASLLVMTKSAVFGLLVSYILYLYILAPKGKLALIFMSIVILFGFGYLLTYIHSTPLFGRMKFVYENYSIIGLILSGRDQHLLSGIEVFYDNFNLYHLLYGFGYDNFRSLMEGEFGVKIGIEMDFFDLIFKNGILVTSLYLFPVLLILRKALFSKLDSISHFFGLIYCLLVLLSFISGHILMSGLVGYVLPFVSVLIYKKYARSLA